MKLALVLILLFFIAAQAFSMEINVNPRSIISSLDKSISPELDILRVTTDISADNHIIFQVKTKGERIEGEEDDYLLLQILHEKTYIFLIPINKNKENKVLSYKNTLQMDSTLPKVFEESKEYSLLTDLSAKRILNGVEFSLPLDWINFNADFGFDAYTVKASIKDETLHIYKIYDQAGKGRNREKLFSAILLLNKLCAPKRLN